MIKVVFAPGSYGSFLTKCIYAFTELGFKQDQVLDFDATGSSHDHWSNSDADSKITWGHLSKADFKYTNTNVVIRPSADRCLEYYVNQYVKSEKNDPVRFLLTQFDHSEIDSKLENWKYTGSVHTAPRWILRELLSYSIPDIFSNAYNIHQYQMIPSAIKIDSEDLFENLIGTIHDIADATGIKVLASNDVIAQTQSIFYKKQKYHNCQYQAQSYVHAVKNKQDYNISNMNFVIESYIQYQLREAGIKLACEDLAVFPMNTLAMQEMYT